MHHIPSKRYQQLQPEERMTIASLLQQRYTITQIAQRLKRSGGTISRELKRNAQDGCYASQVATTCARQRRRSGRPAKKLHAEGILFGVVHHFLNQRWSPEQIALTLASIYPKGHELRVSTETIYNCIYAQPVGQLKKDLIQAMRHARNKRVPRSKGQDRRGQIPDMLSIHLRPPHIEDRLLSGHWEGDLIKGAANASAVGTLVERTSRVVMLVKLPESKPASAANVLQGFTDKLLSIHSPCATA
jgi:transposase, IS30 family